jgi:hypothetical protein
MRLPQKIREEMTAAALSVSLREDMRIKAEQKRKQFLRDGKTSADDYIAFVMAFNEFINHEPKPFRRIPDQDMVL